MNNKVGGRISHSYSYYKKIGFLSYNSENLKYCETNPLFIICKDYNYFCKIQI